MTTGEPGAQPGDPQEPHGPASQTPPPPPSGLPPYGGYAPPQQPAGASARSFGIVGAVIALVGAVGVVLAFTALKWLTNDKDVSNASNDSKFGKIHDALDQLHDQIPANLAKYLDFGIARVYFSWLAWVLFAAAVVIALLALLPTPAAPVLRILGLLVGLAGVGLTFWAIDLVSVSGPLADAVRQRGNKVPKYGDYISHTNVGFWFAVGGFLLIGIGAAVGPRHT